MTEADLGAVEVAEKAILIDRDGIINEMVYYPEHGLVDSPFTVSRFKLMPGVVEALRTFRRMGYRLILVSNQPGVAKKHFSMRVFNQMKRKMNALLAKEGVKLDAEYYCLHHPQAALAKYRVDCECRKPKPGMLLKAAREQGVSLTKSVMIGDGLSDVIAGKDAGVRTVLIANLNSFLMRLMAERSAEPDFIARNLTEAVDIIKRMD